jgi:hypothetical protein
MLWAECLKPTQVNCHLYFNINLQYSLTVKDNKEEFTASKMHISDRVVGCLLYVIKDLQITKVESDEVTLLSQFLEEKGYSSSEISAVIPWLIDRKSPFIEPLLSLGQESMSETHRVLNELESSVISPRAHGYLIQLRELGLISTVEMERILEQAASFGLPIVGESEIEVIASAVLLETDKIPHGTFYHYEHSLLGH